MAVTDPCPDHRDLERLLLGRVAREEAQRLEQHLAGCERCCRAVAALGADDTLVRAMRAAGAAAPAPGEETGPDPVADIIRRAGQLRPARPGGMGGVTEPLVPAADAGGPYGFLSPPAEAGEMGRLGPYRVQKVLGQGGMGVVFQALDPHLRRLVALKVMREAQAAGRRLPRLAAGLVALALAASLLGPAVYRIVTDRGRPVVETDGPPGAGEETPRPEWVALLGGKDLAGWTAEGGPQDAWRAEGGVLTVAGEEPPFHSWLLSEKVYADFVLRFEFRLSEGANSGVALWALPYEKVHAGDGPTHAEVQLLDDAAYPDKGWGTGSLFWNLDGGNTYRPPDRRARLRPSGRWNAMEVEVRGGSLRVAVNGDEVLRASLDELAARPGAFPALRRGEGHVGFQRLVGEASFRKVEIKELPSPRKAVAAVRRWGGKVEVDAKDPGKPVVAVDLTGAPVTDADLAVLQDLPDLRKLTLIRTRVTDAGLARLRVFRKLESLSLSRTAVTDAGMKQVAALSTLRGLGLAGTRVGDEGLAQMRGLAGLERLF